MNNVEMRAGQPLSPSARSILAGGGEMGARMRAMDWSQTPLGPVEEWSQSLTTCVRIMLTSRQPMWLGWGDDLTYLYNDPYRSIAGGKHPEALGKPTKVVWHEIWDDIGPRIESTMVGQEGTYDEALLLIMERNGYPEETYYTFSYSPIPDDDGTIRGIFCANTEDTRSIIGERQVGLLRELAATTVDARTIEDACSLSARCLEANQHDLPFALIYLLDSTHRQATLAGTANIVGGQPAAPAVISLDEPSPFRLADVVGAGSARVIDDIDTIFDELPTGAWDRPPRQAVAVPIAPSGETGQAGVLIAGLNPYRLFDDDYRGFLGLVSSQIGAAIANAQAYVKERSRAEALTELDRAKTAFFSNVSHEFRTPLTLMLGPMEEMLASEDLTPSQRSELDVVHRNSLRLLRMVNTLLDFSRIEAGRARASYERVDLPQLTADLASAFRSAIERAGLQLTVETPSLPDGVETYVDREMWEKIVLNLLSNAFKFTFDGGIAVSVLPSTDRRSVSLTVSDTGTGIPSSELPRMFERFHRIQGTQARTHEGTGIGLALVQELVILHGGTVSVESEIGKGTRFTVTIPTGAQHLPAGQLATGATLTPTASAAPAFVEEALRWLPGNSTLPLGLAAGELAIKIDGVQATEEEAGSRARILVVDDNADMRDYVARLLAGDYDVETVPDGEAALAAVHEHAPNLVLSDAMMPRLDGFGLLRALRDDPRTSTIPVIMLSARAGDEAAVAGLAAGADDYVVKPFTASALKARVSTQLQLARVRTEAADRERAALAEAEQERARLREIFELAPAAIAVLRSNEHVFQLANEHFVRIFGPQRTYISRPFHSVFPDVDLAGIQDRLDHVYSTGEPFVGSELSVDVDSRRNGTLETAYVNFVLQPLRDGVGEVEGLFIHAVDVTAQVRARNEIEAAVRARDEFLSIAAHELRTPVTSIKGVAQLLQRLHRRAKLDEGRLTRNLESIVAQADRLGGLVVDLLDISRLRGGQLALRPRELDLAELVRVAVDNCQDRLEDNRHTLIIEGAGEPCPMIGDPDRLEQILANLLDNAVKYSPDGGGITVRLASNAETASVSVTDSGIGLTNEMHLRIFEPFGRAANATEHNIPGLGLGLYISRQIAERHGGSLDAASDGLGLGTTIRLTLPRSTTFVPA